MESGQRAQDSDEEGGLTRSVLEAIARLRAADDRLHFTAPNSSARVEAEREVEDRLRDVRDLVDTDADPDDSSPAPV